MRTKGRRAGMVTMWTGLALLLAGCAGDGPAGPEVAGQCLAGLQLDGTLYVLEETRVDAADVGDMVGEVLRKVGCFDTPGDGDPDDTIKYDGDSNILAEGTEIHRVTGRDADEALTAFHQGRWVLLVAEATRAASAIRVREGL